MPELNSLLTPLLKPLLLAAGLVAATTSLPAAAAADGMPESLTGVPGDAARGRAIVTSRQTGLCLLCHAGPFAEVEQQGNLAPPLAGIGSRYSEAQLRLRVALPRQLNPDSLMPAYLPSRGRVREAVAYRGQSVLTPQQIEDVVALLVILRE